MVLGERWGEGSWGWGPGWVLVVVGWEEPPCRAKWNQVGSSWATAHVLVPSEFVHVLLEAPLGRPQGPCATMGDRRRSEQSSDQKSLPCPPLSFSWTPSVFLTPAPPLCLLFALISLRLLLPLCFLLTRVILCISLLFFHSFFSLFLFLPPSLLPLPHLPLSLILSLPLLPPLSPFLSLSPPFTLPLFLPPSYFDFT